VSGEAGIAPVRRVWLAALSLLVLAFLVLPVFIVLPMSFSDSQYLEFPPRAWSLRWYRAYLGSADWMAATRVSLLAALLATALATPLGLAAAWGLHRAGGRTARLIRTALVAPLVVPVIILAIGVFYLYVRLGLVNTLAGLVLAHAALALPFVLVLIDAGLRRIDLDQERVARSLGAPPLRAFATVVLPQLERSLVAAALLAFITSLDEVVVALFVSGGPMATLTRRMFTGLRDQVDPTIAAVSSLLILLSVGLLGLAQLLLRRR
jgi:putative spermidine/putrescine transport system permease protein